MIKPDQDENRREHPCWNRDFQTQALRVELADGSFYVFPYSRLDCVRFEPGNDHDLLHVFLDAHEIQIAGKHLREVGLALQKSTVDWVKELPARFGQQADDDHAWIEHINVKELEE